MASAVDAAVDPKPVSPESRPLGTKLISGIRERLHPRLGATVTTAGTRFAVWSTRAARVEVRLYATAERAGRTELLSPRGGGLFDCLLADVGPGALYTFVLDGREVPDPYARFLPRGVHGPARVEAQVRPAGRRRFTTAPFEKWVLYELHLGTFTAAGTYRAAREHLAELAALGVNAIELMPLASFAGARGWGYDGVALFAPHAPYGSPADLRAFVAEAHKRGIAVVLDVVYNHFGPAGNYLTAYSPEYFTSRVKTPWGDSPDYENPFLRHLVLDNARYWLEEYDFDGLRLDATHAIHDPSPSHVLSDIVRLAQGFERKRVVMAEDERNDPKLCTEYGLDAVWADDFHHSIRVLLTGDREGYFEGYQRDLHELARILERGWLYEGQVYPPSGEPRGKPADTLAPTNLIYCVSNHDQVGNRALGTRLHHDAGIDAHLAAATLLLFLPAVPLLFMGQEWSASSPFLFFTDHEPELGHAITEGRREEFRGFAAFSSDQAREHIPDPQAPDTFARSHLDWSERTQGDHARSLELYRRLIALRATDPVLAGDPAAKNQLACEVHGGVLLVRRTRGGERRVLLFNPGKASEEIPLTLTDDAILVASGPREGVARLPPQSAWIVREPVPA